MLKTINTSIPFDDIFFAADADMTFTPAQIREALPSDVMQAFHTMHDATNGGYMTVTNSGREGLDSMMGRELPFLASNGTIARFAEGEDIVLHPELTISINELDELMKGLV